MITKLNSFVNSIASAYKPDYVYVLISKLESVQFKNSKFLKWFVSTDDFSMRNAKSSQNVNGKVARRTKLGERASLLLYLVFVFALLFVVSGILLTISAFRGEIPEGSLFALAIFIGLPILLASSLVVSNIIYACVTSLNIKAIGKSIVCIMLEAQVVKLRRKYKFDVVAVVGSVGKTSTKLAIANTLQYSGKKVMFQEGNFNDRLTVPLVVFNQDLPGLFNLNAWRKILKNNRKIIRNGYDYDVVVLELGTDRPGQIRQFSYLTPDITVITAIAEEHMEYFDSLDAVAEEELSIVEHSKRVLLNTDDVAEHYRDTLEYTGYGLLQKNVDYYIESKHEDLNGQEVKCFSGSHNFAQGKITYLGPHGRKIVLAAAAVAHILDIESNVIDSSISRLEPFAGRMQILKGVKNSVIIDDTYNASPVAVEAALKVLSGAEVNYKIAVLGSMNELGDFSVEAHKTIGASIDSRKVDLVVTVGVEARDYIAPAAAEQGCNVISFLNPHEAGEYVTKNIKPKSVVLFKGSQNGVFCEEAIKPVLKNPSDKDKLVRQSVYWMKQKRKQFKLPK